MGFCSVCLSVWASFLSASMCELNFCVSLCVGFSVSLDVGASVLFSSM